MFNDISNLYEKTKAWSKKHPIISACMFICGGYFFYNLIFSFMYPKNPRIKSNKKGDTKISAEKVTTTPKKSIETPPINENKPQKEEIMKREYEDFLNFGNQQQQQLFNPNLFQGTPETPKVTSTTPTTTTPSTPTPIDEDMFKLKPVQAVCKSDDVNISLETYAGKYLFLIFYPQNLAKKAEIISLNKSMTKFESLNVALVGCSNDNKFSHANLNRTLGKDCIYFPLIGDDKNKMSSVFNIGLDKNEKNKPTTLVYSPTGELIKRIESIDVNTLLAEAEKLQSTS
jgi:peroxiredoxin